MRHISLFASMAIFFSLTVVDGVESSETIPTERTSKKNVSLQSSLDLAVGILDAGELKHTVYNNGLLGTWGWSGYLIPELPAGWYKGYGYVPDFNIWIGIPEGPWTPTYWDDYREEWVSMGPTVSEAQLRGGTIQSDWDPTPGSLGRYHSGDVTVGDVIPGAPLSAVPLMATSTIPESWPEDEYGKREWPGPWARDPVTGQEMAGVFTADKEVFFSFTDDPFADRDELTDQGYPIGAQVDAWVLSYDRSYAEDFLFFSCQLINTSDWHYSGVYVAFYFDVDVEEYDLYEIINDRMDWMDFITTEYEEHLDNTIAYHMAFIYDYRPEPNWRPYVGVKLLETPEGPDGKELGLTDWHWFEWENRPGVIIEERQELIQYKVISGDNTELRPEEESAYFHADAEGNVDPHFDSAENIPRLYPQGTDCVFLMSSGPFEWAPHETTSFSFCLIMGDDRDDLKRNARTAQAMYNYHYQGQKITVTSPNGGEVWSGTQHITWETESITGDPVNAIDIFYSQNGATTWDTITVGDENDGTYSWNTLDVSDGVQYTIKVAGSDGHLPGEDVSDSLFTINNPGDMVPEVVWVTPNGGEYVSGIYEVQWHADDADGQAVTCSVEYSANGGAIWELVVSDVENTGRYIWDTRSFANSSTGLIRVKATDPTSLTGGRQSDRVFVVSNERRDVIAVQPLSGTLGNGIMYVVVIDPAALMGHRYRISFDDSTMAGTLLYDVFDETAGVYVLQNRDEIATEYGPEMEGPLFDGLRLSIRNWDEIDIWPDSSSIELGPLTDMTNVDFSMVPFVPRPADYEVLFTEAGDISLNNVTSPFEIVNMTDNIHLYFRVLEYAETRDNEWQYGEAIQLWEENLPTWTITIFVRPETLGIAGYDTIPSPSGGPPDTIWHYIFGDTLPLHTGDAIILKTKKPFMGGDAFFFETEPQANAIVYPGDTDNSGRVDSLDVLPLGVYWRETGMARSEASTQWTPQECGFWTQSSATYVDCDGNGLIDCRDILAIGQHWELTHELTGTSRQIRLDDPILYTPKTQQAFRALYDAIGDHPEDRAMKSIKNLLHRVLRYDGSLLPIEFRLEQNYPNPFNPSTNIGYQIPVVDSRVPTTLKIYNILGQEVRTLVDDKMDAGYYSVTWDGRDGHRREVSSGIYFYRIKAGTFSNTKRMVIIR
jgi:hypothetical protein